MHSFTGFENLTLCLLWSVKYLEDFWVLLISQMACCYFPCLWKHSAHTTWLCTWEYKKSYVVLNRVMLFSSPETGIYTYIYGLDWADVTHSPAARILIDGMEPLSFTLNRCHEVIPFLSFFMLAPEWLYVWLKEFMLTGKFMVLDWEILITVCRWSKLS